jgi:hypothetical protein
MLDKKSLRAAVFQVLIALVLVGGTAAVVRAQPMQPQVVNPGVVPAAVQAAVDALKPVQLPNWMTVPTGSCTLGEMAMVTDGNGPAKLYVCKGNHVGPCLSQTTQTVYDCVPTDGLCTQVGGNPVGSSTAPNTAPCVGYRGTRACGHRHPVCVLYSSPPSTHWEVVTTTLP